VLDDAQKQQLDRLWQELDFITLAPIRQHTGFIWYERAESRTIKAPEFDSFRSEDKDITSEAKIKQLAELYLKQARKNAPADGSADEALKAVEDFFTNVNANVRHLEQARLAAEPSHLKSLLNFAQRAYRRPLSEAEQANLLAFYHSLRDKDGLSHEDALRDSLVVILMSPNFCFHVDLDVVGDRPQALSDYALASRLSYFLWSSLPDDALLGHAAAGDLHEPKVLQAETQRMIHDPRIRGFAVEFGGHWLDFRQFQQHNSVDRQRFPSFTNELREAMFEEPVRFLIDMIQNDRSVLDCLYSNYTLVNPVLAKHYGMPEMHTAADQWMRGRTPISSSAAGCCPWRCF
jgi:hypothetical protein